MIVEDEAAALRRSWGQRPMFSPFRPLYPAVTFVNDWLVVGDGTLLARIAEASSGETELVFEGGEARVLALLALAYLRPTPARTLDHMRRGARDWARGEKCLAYVHLALGGLARLDEPEEAAFRLFMADGLLRAGAPARDLVKALDLGTGPIDLLEKYSPDQARVPQGNGRESGQWTSGDSAQSTAGGVSVTPITWRSRSSSPAKSGHYIPDHRKPKDAVSVTRNDGAVVQDPSSSTGTLLAPSRGDYSDIYAEGESIRLLPLLTQEIIIGESLAHGGTYDFQRDKATMAFIPVYTNASNYAVGVYMAGAGFPESATIAIAEIYAWRHSSNYGARNQIEWIKRGWNDAHAGHWK